MNLGWKKTLVYSLLPVTLLLAFLEGAARVAEMGWPPLPVDYGGGFNADSRLFVPSPDQPGTMITNPAKLVSFQSQWFKLPKPPRAFRVFVVGGSSVNYASGQLWTEGLKLSLKYGGKRLVEIINCGGCAYGSHRHIPIVAEVLDYQPDLILYYEANNEFEETEQMRWIRPGMVSLQRILYRSAFCRFVRDRWANAELARLERDRNERLLSMEKPDNNSGTNHEWTPEEIDEHMEVFRNNISIIVSMCQARNVPIILSTVASNLWKPRLDFARDQVARIQSFYEEGKYEEGMAFARDLLKRSVRHQASDTENGILRDIAAQYHVPLADVASAVAAAEPHKVPGETLFNDHCHLNDKGIDIMMRVFEAQIEKVIEQRPVQ